MPNSTGARSVLSSRYRWVICALLFLATTCNYMDRQVLGILAPQLHDELGWSELEYGHIVSAFQLAYAIGLFFSGWFVDRIGSRMGLSLAVFLWSIASIAHGFARNATQFAAARFGLGLAEAANFPASIKSVSEWFPERERPFAIGLFNSGANLGAILTPLIVPWIAISFGWQTAFYALGSLGMLWVVVAWYLFITPDTSLRGDEYSGHPGGLQHLREVLSLGITWKFALSKFLTDPVWWFYLYWTPKYLGNSFGLKLSGLGLPLVIIYLAADIGSIGGGWSSGFLARRGLSEARARISVMFLCAILPLPVILLAGTTDLFWAVAILSVATAAHQGWSANLFATASSLVAKDKVASVIGVGGMAGALGGIVLAEVAGHVLEYTGSYMPLFTVCSLAYLVALIVVRR